MAAGLAMVAIAIVFLLGSRLSRHMRNLTFEVSGESISGLSKGGKVQLRGIEVGTVTSLGFDPKDPERILIGVDVDPISPVYKNATATMEIFGITGLKYIDIAPGDPKLGLAPEGSTLKIVPSLTDKLLNTLDTISHSSSRLMNNLENLTSPKRQEQIDSILLDLRQTSSEFRGMATDLRAAHLDAQISKVANQVSTTVFRIDSTVSAIKPARSIARMDSATTAVSSLARRADLMLGRSQADIYRSLEDFSTTMRNLSDFSQTIRNNPAALLRPGERDNK